MQAGCVSGKVAFLEAAWLTAREVLLSIPSVSVRSEALWHLRVVCNMFHFPSPSPRLVNQGGLSGLIGAIVVGPRLGRFVGNNVREFETQDSSLSALGTVLLWFGWYGYAPPPSLFLSFFSFTFPLSLPLSRAPPITRIGTCISLSLSTSFNCSSTGNMSGSSPYIAARAAVNTTLSGAAGALGTLGLCYWRKPGELNLEHTLNGTFPSTY
jgi:hypothetical protein